MYSRSNDDYGGGEHSFSCSEDSFRDEGNASSGDARDCSYNNFFAGGAFLPKHRDNSVQQKSPKLGGKDNEILLLQPKMQMFLDNVNRTLHGLLAEQQQELSDLQSLLARREMESNQEAASDDIKLICLQGDLNKSKARAAAAMKELEEEKTSHSETRTKLQEREREITALENSKTVTTDTQATWEEINSLKQQLEDLWLPTQQMLSWKKLSACQCRNWKNS